MEFMINEILELLPFIGVAGFWSMNKPSPFSPFPKKPRAQGEEVYTPDTSEFEFGSGAPPSQFNKTETILGSDPSLKDDPNQYGTGIVTRNQSSGMTNIIDTKNIDFGDENQVKNIQRAIGVKDDGQWGPDTEKAYQQYINERRESQGLGQYMYDDLPTSKNNNNIGTLSDDNGANNGVNSTNTTYAIPWGGSFFIPGMEEEQINPNLEEDVDTWMEENPGPPDKNKFWGPDKLWNWMGYE